MDKQTVESLEEVSVRLQRADAHVQLILDRDGLTLQRVRNALYLVHTVKETLSELEHTVIARLEQE